MRTNQVRLQKKSSQGVPHVGNIACMNHADLNQTKLKSADEGKRLVSWLLRNSVFKINRSKLGPSLEDGIVHSCIFKSTTNQKVQMTASDFLHYQFYSRLFSKDADSKINRSKVGTNYVVSVCSIVHF
jgi:hypothetical protein